MSDTSANNSQGGPQGPHKSTSNSPGNADAELKTGEDFPGFEEGDETVIKMPGRDESREANHEKPAVDPTAEWKGKVAYLSAEIENMRKRFIREKAEVIRYANEELIKQVLPVLDNLEFALKASKDAEAKSEASVRESPMMVNLIKGLDMTLKHFNQTLEGIGCQPVKGLGEVFDPHCHEALGQTNQPEVPDNQITGVMQRGFSLSGRVIRPARVMVNKVGTPSA